MILEREPIPFRERISKLFRFAAIGLAGTAVYALVAYGMVWNGHATLHAHVVGTAVSLIVSYFGQKIFTFKIRGQHRRSGPRFIIATAIVVAGHFGLVWLFQSLKTPPNLTLLVGIMYYPPASYLVHTYWTFRMLTK